jgi:hypothetical protein
MSPSLTLSVPGMLAIWHHLIVSFKVLAQKVFIGTWVSWVKCISERLTVFSDGWMLDVWAARPSQPMLVPHSPCIQHRPILASQEHLTLWGLKGHTI